jgi:hypothetical protein
VPKKASSTPLTTTNPIIHQEPSTWLSPARFSGRSQVGRVRRFIIAASVDTSQSFSISEYESILTKRVGMRERP